MLLLLLLFLALICWEVVFKDLDVNRLCGFSITFVKDFVFKIEARVVLEGLIIAWDKGFRHIQVECDNALLVELFLAGERENSNLVELCLLHQILIRRWSVRNHHITRIHNEVTVHMVKCYIPSVSNLQEYDDLPDSIKNLLLIDLTRSMSN